MPIGKDENSNKEIKKNGSIPKFDFTPISHYQLGKNLNLMDFDTATKHQDRDLFFLKENLLS